MKNESNQIVEHLFRTEYGKLVAILTRIFGPSNIQLAEDIVQETLIAALHHWSLSGLPANPTGWLVQVAKRKALNELKRNQMMQKHHQAGFLNKNEGLEIDTVFLPEEIEDSQLRMIFTCCHLSLSTESKIALTLKTLCGFGVKEVANALLINESTINKRLYRAKKTIRESDLPFDIPQGKELDERLETVCLTLYLLFNEGYNSSVGSSIIRKELCLEAIRLIKLLLNHFDKNKKLYALLSLMCFHVARFGARIDDHGAIILFKDQNRNQWNKDLINVGMQYFQKSIGDVALSTYHIEASIAAEHCLAKSFDTTNWQSIYDKYLLLEKINPNPVIKLNLAIIYSEIKGVKASLKLLEKLSKNKTLDKYHLLPATQGMFNMKLGFYKKAISFFQIALDLKPSAMENNFINSKIAACQNKLLKK